ncbi:MAG: antitoxin family protein [Planctomycetaceae bacterium]
MRRLFDAVYENGVFRLLGAPATGLHEGQRVRISLETSTSAGAASAEEWLEQAGKVYEGLSAEEINEIERIAIEGGRRSGDVHE